MSTDAVITWVDGADPLHRLRLAAYLAERGGTPPATAHATRFNDAGEIDYCVASILRFAPWFRRIHIVSDSQTPALLAHMKAHPVWRDRVRVVDHREIFRGFEQHLPTFNSRSIISLLWRIPDLAEQFVYFNDDMALLRPLTEGDFFRDDRVVLRGEWRAQSHLLPAFRIKQWWRQRDPRRERVGNLDSQQFSARIAGFRDRYYRLFHNPYPMRRSVLERFFAENPDRLEANIRHRLRSAEQFKTESLATHLEIAHHDAILDNRLHTVQLKPSEQPLWRVVRKMARADRDAHAAFVVVQSIELAPVATQARIAAWLDRRIGRPETVRPRDDGADHATAFPSSS